ncbi:MAG: glycosyltransferase family 2 protein [Candidatus Hydrogenedentota bacterium]|nr:MAG: glycosyltransferase family 2 protein [Candidatus Hydrogenedentota bacterium]
MSLSSTSKNKSRYDLSLIIPFYDEGSNLVEAARAAQKSLIESSLSFEILLVDDGSTDESGAEARRLAEEHPSVFRYLSHTRNRGLGAAFWTGARAAVGRFVLLVPVDNPVGPELLENFFRKAEEAAVVVGVRGPREGYSLIQKIASRALYLLARYLFRLPDLGDYTWIALYDRSFLQSLDPTQTGILYNIEILATARRQNRPLKSTSAPMKPRTRGRGTVGRVSAWFRTAHEFFRLLYRFHFRD